MGHISTKLHQFLIGSFRILCGQTHRQTDAAKTIPARSIAGAQVNILYAYERLYDTTILIIIGGVMRTDWYFELEDGTGKCAS